MDPLIGRVVLERYEVLRRIGSGGMGAVYVARQIAVGREIALKILRADLMQNESVRERFRREAEIIGKLRHPNTIQLIDYGETSEGLCIMAMELLVGIVLSDRLKQLGPLPVRDALRVGYEVAIALAEAHGVGLVHRDLKPANIFLVEVAGQVHAKVLDFGIARILDEEATRITSTGQVFGTPRYMSPEQGMASGEVDSRTDIYSLGLIVYECLVGQPPFVAETSIQYLSAHATLPPPKLSAHLPNAPVELDELIDACLVKERGHRMQTAADVAEALRRITLKLDSQVAVGEATAADLGSERATAAGVMAADTSSSSIADLLPDRPVRDTPVVPVAIPKPPVSKPRVSKPPPTTDPSVVVTASDSKSPMMIAAAVALLLAIGIVVAVLVLKPVDPPIATAVDVGAVPDVVPDVVPNRVVDAGQATAVVVAPKPDAGHEAEPESIDAGQLAVTTAPDTGVKRRRRRKNNNTSDSTLPGADVIRGPRDMMIPVGDESNRTLTAAKSCTTSQVSGPAKLTLKSCKKNCAVLIDGACAGRTPLADVDVPSGIKSVAVVCDGKVVIDDVARLKKGQSTTMSCR